MKPPPFKYEKPDSVDGLIAALAAHGDNAKILAGGQSLVPMMNFRVVAPEVLIDINGLSELDYIRVEGGTVRIGALTRHAALCDSAQLVEACPLMAEAYAYVAHKTVRNRGTLGGNLCHADPASEMPAVMVCLDATLMVRGKGGDRRVPAADFFVGPLETVLEPTELLAEVQVPVRGPGEGWSFREVSPRQGDFAIAAVAATVRLASGVCASARIAHAGVSGHTSRVPQVEGMLSGQALKDDLIASAAAAMASAIEVEVVNFHGDEDYKRDLVKTLTERALTQARDRCAG